MSAVAELLRFIKQAHPDIKSVALVTDHIAITTGQRRWWSGCGGFPTPHCPNDACNEMRNYAQAFCVEGHLNASDADSRPPEAAAAKQIECSEIDMAWPSPSAFLHPYATRTGVRGF